MFQIRFHTGSGGRRELRMLQVSETTGRQFSQSGCGTTFLKRCNLLQVSPGLISQQEYISTSFVSVWLWQQYTSSQPALRLALAVANIDKPFCSREGNKEESNAIDMRVWRDGRPRGSLRLRRHCASPVEETSHLILPEFSWMSGGQWKQTQDQEEVKTSGGSRRWSIWSYKSFRSQHTHKKMLKPKIYIFFLCFSSVKL